MNEVIKDAKKLLELSPDHEIDEYALEKLKNRLYRLNNRNIEYLAKIEYYINGKGYDNLLRGFYEVDELKKIKFKFLEPNIEGAWNFSKPTKELKEKEGKGICETFDYDPTSLNNWLESEHADMEKVMVRAFVSDFYVPISILKKSQYHHAEEIPRQYDPVLMKLNDLWSDVRSGVLPMEIRFSLYTQTGRYSLVIDPINNKMKPHPLGYVSSVDSVDREPLDYMIFDKILAYMEYSPLVKSIFELLFETEEMSISDVAGRLNMDHNIAKNNLISLESGGFVEKKKEMYYRINMDDLKKMAEDLPSLG